MARRLLVLLALGALAGRAVGAQPAAAIASLSLDELAKIRVVVVSKVEESVAGAPASVTVISAADMRRMGWRTVAEVLDATPGMLTTSSFGVRFAPAIRGDIRATGGVHVLVLLDGRPLRGSMDALSTQDLFAHIPVSMLDRIEVIRGPGSVLYGTNAIAGVINLVTETGDSSAIQVEGSAGSLDSRSTLVRGIVQTERARFSLTAQALDEPKLVRNAADVRGQGREVTLPGRGNFLFGAVTAGAGSLTALYSDWNGPSLRSARAGLPEASFRAQELAVNGALHGELNPQVRGQLDLGFTGTRSIWDPALGIRPVSNDLLLEGTLFAQLNHRWHLLAGSVANLLTGNATYLSKPSLDYRQWSASTYLQADYRPSDALRLMIGAQAIKAPTEPAQVVPRAALVYEGGSGFGAKFVYGEAFRAPSPAETNIDQPPLVVGNPNLRSERVRTSEAIFSMRRERGELTLSLFDSRQMNLITAVVDADEASTFANRGTFEARGGEVEARFLPSAVWQVFGSLSYQGNTFDDTLHDVGRSPQTIVRLGASWTPQPTVTVSLFDNWLGAAPPLRRLFPSVPLVNPPSADYHLVSAHLDVQVGSLVGFAAPSRLTATLRVDNLLDQATWFSDATFGAVNTLPWRPGRVVTVGVRMGRAGP